MRQTKISFFDFDKWVLQMLYYDKNDLGEIIDPDKSNDSKNVGFTTIGVLIMGLNIKILFVMVVMIF